MIYLLDTTIISDLVKKRANMNVMSAAKVAQGHILTLCSVTHYEVVRGWLKDNALAQLKAYNFQLRPKFEWVSVIDQDWEQAAKFYAMTRSRGRQLSDMDLLLAAVAVRLNATIASSDVDFDALPIKREDWRVTP